MYKYYNLQQRFGARIMFDDGSGAGSGGSGEGGQGAGQIDYAELLKDPKALEAFQNTDFFKKAVQSETDKVRTKATGEKKTLEQRLEEQEKANAELMAFKNETVKVRVLKEMGVPLQFWDVITAGDEETVKATAQKLLDAHKAVLTTEVEQRFKTAGSDPNKGASDKKLTKEELSKLTYAERLKLYQENKENF